MFRAGRYEQERATLPNSNTAPKKTASRKRSQFRGRAIPATRSMSHPLRDGFGCYAPRSKDHQRLKQPPPPNIDVIKSKSVTPSSDCSFQKKRNEVRQSQPPQIRYRAADIRYIRPSTIKYPSRHNPVRFSRGFADNGQHRQCPHFTERERAAGESAVTSWTVTRSCASWGSLQRWNAGTTSEPEACRSPQLRKRLRRCRSSSTLRSRCIGRTPDNGKQTAGNQGSRGNPEFFNVCLLCISLAH